MTRVRERVSSQIGEIGRHSHSIKLEWIEIQKLGGHGGRDELEKSSRGAHLNIIVCRAPATDRATVEETLETAQLISFKAAAIAPHLQNLKKPIK